MRELWIEVLGARLRYFEAGEGPPLLLLPSAAGRAAEYFELIPLLEKTAHVFALDYPGFGQSDSLLSLQSSKDFAHFVGEWRKALGFEQCDVAGFSLGGWLALHMALSQPETMGRLILIATSAGKDANVPLISPAGLSFKEILDQFYVRPEVKARLAGQKLSPEEKKEIHRSTQAFDRLVAKGSLLPQFQDCLHEITLPTLVLAADGDRVMPFFYQQQLHRGIPKAQLTVLSECGHAMIAERPHEVAKAMITFLQNPSGACA